MSATGSLQLLLRVRCAAVRCCSGGADGWRVKVSISGRLAGRCASGALLLARPPLSSTKSPEARTGGAGAGEMPSARRARQLISGTGPSSSQAFPQQTPARCAAAGARGPRANRRHSVWCVWGARGRWRGSGLVPAGGAVGWSRVCERDAADGAHSSRAAAAAGGGAALSTSCRLLAAGCWPCGTDDALCLQHAAHAACRTSRAVSCPVHRASGPTGCGQLATQVQCERLSAGAAGASQAAGMPAADR